MAKLGREATKRRGMAPKVAQVEQMTAVLKSGQGWFILARNKGLTYGQATDLRAKARAAKVKIKVSKNTLLRIALTNAGFDPAPLKGLLKLETLVAVGTEDPVTPAKLLVDFMKANEGKLEIKGGFLDGKVLSADEIRNLATLPGRDELLAKMLGSMMAPVQNLVYALNQTVSKVVYVVDARRRQLEEGNAA